MAGHHLVGPERGDEDDREIAGAAAEHGEQLGGGVVGPVRVLDDYRRGAATPEFGDERAEQLVTARWRRDFEFVRIEQVDSDGQVHLVAVPPDDPTAVHLLARSA
jgi:hypothetical protein